MADEIWSRERRHALSRASTTVRRATRTIPWALARNVPEIRRGAAPRVVVAAVATVESAFILSRYGATTASTTITTTATSGVVLETKTKKKGEDRARGRSAECVGPRALRYSHFRLAFIPLLPHLSVVSFLHVHADRRCTRARTAVDNRDTRAEIRVHFSTLQESAGWRRGR